MTKVTRQEIANDYNLWVEYVDVDATMTEDEFNAMSEDEKMALMSDMFGEE